MQGRVRRVVGVGRWPRRAARLGAVGLVWLLVPGAVRAQVGGVELEARAGVVVSTPLVEGLVAFPASPGGGADSVQAFRVRPVTAPMVVVAGRTGLGPDLSLELSAGWTFSRVEGSQGGETWRVGDLGVGHAVASLRRRVLERLHVRGGLGLIRYGSDAGLFEGSPGMRPVLEVGAGAELELGGARVSLSGVGQAHSFGSTALRNGAGSGVRGLDGTVYRFALQAGVVLGGGLR